MNDEAESKEAQELFFALGAVWAQSKKASFNSDPMSFIYFNGSSIYYGHDDENDEDWFLSSSSGQELTLPQLRDLVAQSKAKSIEFLEPQDDGTYKLVNWTCMSCPPENFIEVPDEAELYVYWPHDKDYHFQSGQGFYEDGGWNLCSFSVEEIKKGDAGAEILWSREPIQEQGLISGADALRALAEKKNVQCSIAGKNDWTVDILTITPYYFIGMGSGQFQFRLKPRTIRLELEIPACGKNYKHGQLIWILNSLEPNEYCSVILDESDELPAYWWETEEEIKQVVAAFRGGIKA